MTIREATDADVPAIATLAEHFLATPYARTYLGASRAGLELFTTYLLEQPLCTVIVAQLEETCELVGFIALLGGGSPLDEAHAVCEELAWWVEPDARGAGRVGARLLDAAEAWARAHGLKWLKMVAPHQSRVGRFYERRGYVPVETAYSKGLVDGSRTRPSPDVRGRER